MVNETPIDIVIVDKTKRGRDQVVKSLDDIEKAAGGTGRAIGGAEKSLTKFGSAGVTTKKILTGVVAALSIRQIVQFTRSIVDATVELEGLNITLETVFGSVQEAQKQFRFVAGEADRLGISLINSEKSFAKFAAATTGAGISVENTRKIFTSISEASAVLNLNTADTNLVFIALEQIASKGVVSMEELRQQLGERIPGTMKIAADAMDLPIAQFQKLVAAGEVISDEFLPKFADALSEKFGAGVEKATDRAAASFARFENAVFNLQTSIGRSGLVDALAGIADNMTLIVKAATDLSRVEIFTGQGKGGIFGLAAIGETISGIGIRIKDEVEIVVGSIITAEQKITKLRSDLAKLGQDPRFSEKGRSRITKAIEKEEKALKTLIMRRKVLLGITEEDIAARKKALVVGVTEGKIASKLIDSLEGKAQTLRLSTAATVEETLALLDLTDATTGPGGQVEAIKKLLTEIDRLEQKKKESSKGFDVMAEAGKNAFNDIKDAADDALVNLFEGNIQNVKDFFNEVKSIGIRALVEIGTSKALSGFGFNAATGAFGGARTRGAGAAGGGGIGGSDIASTGLSIAGGGIANAAGFSFGLGGFGGIPFGGFAGATGVAAGGGAASLGSTVLAGIGAAAPFLIAAAIPLIIGALQKQKRAFSGAITAISETGEFTSERSKASSVTDTNAVDALFGTVTGFLATISQQTGARFGEGTNLGVELGKDANDFRILVEDEFIDSLDNIKEKIAFDPQDEESISNAIANVTLRFLETADVGDDVAIALQNINSELTSADELLSDLTFAANFRGLFLPIKDTFTEFEATIRELTIAFEEASETAKRLGLDENVLTANRVVANKQIKDDFDNQIRRQLLGVRDPQSLALENLNIEFAEIRRNAIAAGADLLQVEQLFAEERSDIISEGIRSASASLTAGVSRFLSGIGLFRNKLELDPKLSLSTNAQRAAAAQGIFSSLQARIAGGDITALDELQRTSEDTLSAIIDNFGSTGPSVEFLSDIKDLLDAGEALANSTLSTEDKILVQNEEQTDLLKQIALGNASIALAGIGGLSNASLLRSGESIDDISKRFTGLNELPTLTVRKLKALAGFDFSAEENKKRSFAEFAKANPDKGVLFNSLVELLGGEGQTFADGGIASGFGLVGERGPEIVNFGSPSRVFSNSESGSMLGMTAMSRALNQLTSLTQANGMAIINRLERVVAQVSESNETLGRLVNN